jgi:hypothetical protein
MRGLFHPHHRETECRINIVHSCLGSWNPLRTVSNSPPPGRFIRLLADPKASLTLQVTWTGDLISIIGHLCLELRDIGRELEVGVGARSFGRRLTSGNRNESS